MNDIQLVRYLLSQQGVSPDELSAHLGVRKRAMRDCIHRANASMAGAALISYDRARGAYVVNISDQQGFDTWVSGRLAHNAYDRLPSTPSERVVYLQQYLLSRSDWITLEELAGLLLVSRSTISSDLQVLERTFEKFDLVIERRPRYGIRVSGSEIDKRLCLASAVINAHLEADGLGGAISPSMLNEVGRCVDATLKRENYKVNPVLHQNLVIHLAIALARIGKGCYMPMETFQMESVQGSSEWAVATVIAQDIEESFSVDLPEGEVAYIAIHLASKRLIEDARGLGMDGVSSASGYAAESGLEVTDEAWNLAAEMLETVWRAFRFDFRNDVELRMNLARHTMPLIVRLRYHMMLKNPLLEDIRVHYPLSFAMAADALALLAERYQAKISDDEVGYVALIFALALERAKTEKAKKHALVVCTTGVGARLLAYQLQQEFSNDFGIVDTCDVSDFDEYKLDGVDYIFTTAPLARRTTIPVVHVSPFIDETGSADVKHALRRVAEPSTSECFSPKLFFANVSIGTREDVISFLCDRCTQAVELPDNFQELVWARERASSTAYGNLVALPHPLEAVSPRTFVAVALLSHAIDWGGRKVCAVFMVCVSRDAGSGSEAFYRSMTKMLMSEQSIQRLLADRRYEVLLSELEGK